MKKSNKKETVQEFLARGGQINKVEKLDNRVETTTVNSVNSGGPAIIMSYGEADLFYGEVRSRKPKKMKQREKIDFSVLPEALRNKYLKDIDHD